jgi:hypothetical protein
MMGWTCSWDGRTKEGKQKYLGGRSLGESSFGRLRSGTEDNIKMDLVG